MSLPFFLFPLSLSPCITHTHTHSLSLSSLLSSAIKFLLLKLTWFNRYKMYIYETSGNEVLKVFHVMRFWCETFQLRVATAKHRITWNIEFRLFAEFYSVLLLLLFHVHFMKTRYTDLFLWMFWKQIICAHVLNVFTVCLQSQQLLWRKVLTANWRECQIYSKPNGRDADMPIYYSLSWLSSFIFH